MELTHTIQAATRVCATLAEDGALALKVFAETDYAPGRGTTAEVHQHELPPAVQAAIKAALQAALSHATEQLGARLAKAVHVSADVAARNGELS